MDPINDIVRYTPDDYASPLATAAWILAVGIFGMGGLLVYLVGDAIARLRRAARHRRAARIGPLPSHGSLLIVGTVEDEGLPAVTVSIRQRGTETRYRDRRWGWRWKHVWLEAERSVEVRPFILRRPSGERVRIVADKKVLLARKLDGLVVNDRGDQRTRTASLLAGEEICVMGSVASGEDGRGDGYRGERGMAVVGPPPEGRMVISSLSPGQRDMATAGVDAALAALTVGTLAIVHGLVFGGYYALRFAGHIEMATVSRVYVWQRSDRHSTTNVYAALLTAPDGVFNTEISRAFYDVARREGDRTAAPLLVAGRLHQIGSEPSCSGGALAAMVMVACILVGVVIAFRRSKRAWYERSRLSERRSGRLDPQTVTIL